MAAYVWKDKSGVLKAFFEPFIKKEFPELTHAKMLYAFRDNEKKDDEGRPIAAEARKIPNKERDLYGYNFEILVHDVVWAKMSNKEKERLAFHELLHCRVSMDESGEPEKDEHGRLITYLEGHNIYLKTFKEEIERYGIEIDDLETVEFLAEALQNRAKKIKKMKVTTDDDDYEEPVKKKKKKKVEDASGMKVKKKIKK